MSDNERMAMPDADEAREAADSAAGNAAQEQSTPPPAAPTPGAEELAELRRKAAEYDALLDRLKRATADYMNSQRRMERDMQERVRYGIESFARELLPVADNLGRALAAARETPAVETLIGGVDLVEKQLYAIFERHGIRPVPAEQGTPFNPEMHDAIAAVESPSHRPGHIVHETQKGFQFHDRLLRPASVVVSKPPSEDSQAPKGDSRADV